MRLPTLKANSAPTTTTRTTTSLAIKSRPSPSATTRTSLVISKDPTVKNPLTTVEIHTKAKGITMNHAHVKARATGTRSSNSPVTKATAATSSSKVEVIGLPHNIPTTQNMCLPSSSPQTTLVRAMVLGRKLMAVKNLTEVIKTMHNGTLSSLKL